MRGDTSEGRASSWCAAGGGFWEGSVFWRFGKGKDACVWVSIVFFFRLPWGIFSGTDGYLVLLEENCE